MRSGTRIRPDDHDAIERSEADTVTPAAPHPVGNHLIEAMARERRVPPSLLSGLGNHALQRAFGDPRAWTRRPPIQRTRKTHTQMLELTVAEFDAHRKADQMDWANAGFDAATRTLVWGIVDWGLDGLGPIKLGDVVDELRKPAGMRAIKSYCDALTGKHQGAPTVELPALEGMTLEDVLVAGRWVADLTALLTGPRLRAVMPGPVFIDLITYERVAEAFVDYNKTYQPILQAPNGKDTRSIIQFVQDENGKYSDYAGDLPHIKNLHKFPKDSLDKLKSDKTTGGKPLTLIFQALHDHNGAFIRHAHVNEVIRNANTRAYVVEGQSAADIKGLSASGIAKLASTYGLDGKITQVMVAGHGNATLMDMAGTGSDVEKDPGTGEYKVTEKGSVPIAFEPGAFDTFWTGFFEALLSNMETKGGLKPTILLRACLTASNSVDTDQLKKELKATGVIDVDNPRVDPTTEANQVKIRAGIVAYIKAHGSLAKILGDKAKNRAEVLGAQSSITAGSTGSIDPATGQLEMRALSDPKVAAPKIEYVRHGKEPLGAIRAVIESWAEDRDGCFAKMRERIADAVATDDDFIIQLLYRTILASYSNDILGANGFTDTASMLHGISSGREECRPKALRKDKMTQKHRDAFYPLLHARFANDFAKLVLYEDWLEADASKRTAFVDLLGTPAFERRTVKNYLDYSIIDAHVAPILAGTGSTRGRILLALVGFIEGKRDDCKRFLKSQVDGDQKFTADVKGALGGYSENELRKALDLPVEAAPKPSDPAVALPKNIGGGYDYHVEPLRSTGKMMVKASMFSHARLMSHPADDATELDTQYWAKEYTVVGEVKKLTGADAGWYMIRMQDNKVGYMRKSFF